MSFSKVFRKDVIYNNSHKKQGFPLSLKDIFLEKPHGRLTEIDHRCHAYQLTRPWAKTIEFRFIRISFPLVHFQY